MYSLIVFLPILASAIAGLFGRIIGDRASELVTTGALFASLALSLVAFSTFLGDIVGQVFALLVLTVAAAEAAIGLAVLVVYFRNRGSIAVEDVNLMKG